MPDYVVLLVSPEYTCVYRGSLALVCHHRQSMRTGMLSWVMPSFAAGGFGVMGALGSSGLLHLLPEEAMEQMVESGLPPPRPRRPACRRCAPLRCAVSVVREAVRLRAYLQGASARDLQQRYHQCQ